MCWELLWFCCDQLKFKIYNLLYKHMFVCRTSGLIYRKKGSKFAKFVQGAECFDAFDLQVDYRICEAFLGGC